MKSWDDLLCRHCFAPATGSLVLIGVSASLLRFVSLVSHAPMLLFLGT